MNANTGRQWTTLCRSYQARRIAEDLRSGNPQAQSSDLKHLDADQALAWFLALQFETPSSDMAASLAQAIGDQERDERREVDGLIHALLGDITYDQMGELRDVLRGALIEHAKHDIQYYLDVNAVFEDLP